MGRCPLPVTYLKEGPLIHGPRQASTSRILGVGGLTLAKCGGAFSAMSSFGIMRHSRFRKLRCTRTFPKDRFRRAMNFILRAGQGGPLILGLSLTKRIGDSQKYPAEPVSCLYRAASTAFQPCAGVSYKKPLAGAGALVEPKH
jgi:hypothetical protein